ncbi:MAG TPA: D-aminoacylase [Pyrinomonadaceae bacterium]|nr:D-aminoacylase [Pyrinomonadaceae bacterium]
MPKTVSRIILFALVLWPCVLRSQHDTVSQPRRAGRSRVIVGARVIDGSGRPPFSASVRIEGDRIKRVGRFGPAPGELVVYARGLIVAPGFIDIHNHSERGLDAEPTSTTQVSQGITTLAIGPDGDSPWPIADYLARRARSRAAVNVLAFVGHATVRERVLGRDFNRQATSAEIAEMAKLVERGMRDGAFGLSTGLEYDVGHPSTTEEVIELARVSARHGGIYMSHIRDEADDVVNALTEAIRIGREAHLPVQISHIKMGTAGVWGKATQAVALVNSARASGLDITADCYPYDAWASTITVLVPSRRHDDASAVERGLADVGGAAAILITDCPAHRDYEGHTLEDVARAQSRPPVEVYMQIVRDGGADIVCRSMKEADIRVFYREPWVMVASDGGTGSRHPRGAGTFPRVLGLYVRESRWLTLAEAVRKMTSAPARRLGLRDRGLIRTGMKADLVIFDPRRVRDRSTFKEPQVLSRGIERVYVNGRPVWAGGRVTGLLPGVVLRKNAAQASPHPRRLNR